MYSLYVIDIPTGSSIYRHDSFWLWERNIMSFFNINSLDYITLCNDGMFVMTLSKENESKILQDSTNKELNMAHSLSSCNYLKIHKNNHILFSCTGQNKILEI